MLPIYYINTDFRTDRRDHMESTFQQLGLDAIRFEAVLAKDIPKSLVEKYCGPDSKVRHGLGHLACSVSHGEVWKRFIASGSDAALVFEDDALLSVDLPAFLRSIGDKLPDGIDLLKIETYSLDGIRLSTKDTRTIGNFSLSRLIGTHFGACGYIISRTLAERLLRDPNRLDFIVDDYLFGRRSHVIFRYRVYQVVPPLAVQLSILRPEGVGDGIAFSDLGLERASGVQPLNPSRLSLLMRRWRSAAMDVLYFGYDPKGLLGPRQAVTFPSDRIVNTPALQPPA